MKSILQRKNVSGRENLRSAFHRCGGQRSSSQHAPLFPPHYAAGNHAANVAAAPNSIDLIPDNRFDPDAPAIIRQVGSTRRIFLMNPYFNEQELEGLAYRIRTLTKNEGLASVFIATDQTDPSKHRAMPGSLLVRDGVVEDPAYFGTVPVFPEHTYHVSGGYDHLEFYRQGKHKDPKACQSLLRNLSDLSMALRGDARTTRIPTISAIHGAITDGGAAFLNSTYVLATPETRISIENPLRGLSLDPVGLSYFLPRLGEAFSQPAAKYNPGLLIGCFGYQAHAEDLVETGLATHFTDSVNNINLLETALSELRSWRQQGLLKQPKRFYGDPEPREDHNAAFRNVSVSATIDCHSSYRADHCHPWADNIHDEYGDPSMEPDYVPMTMERSSELVNWAATFDEILREKTLVRMLQGLNEVSEIQSTDPEEIEVRDMAAQMVRRMEQQSPMAASITFALLRKGASKLESYESCLQRERRVQAKLLAWDDFERWAKHVNMKSDQKNNGPQFTNWKHKNLSEVSSDEVAEILEAESN